MPNNKDFYPPITAGCIVEVVLDRGTDHRRGDLFYIVYTAGGNQYERVTHTGELTPAENTAVLAFIGANAKAQRIRERGKRKASSTATTIHPPPLTADDIAGVSPE